VQLLAKNWVKLTPDACVTVFRDHHPEGNLIKKLFKKILITLKFVNDALFQLPFPKTIGLHSLQLEDRLERISQAK